MICFGHLAGRMVVVGYTPRGEVRHIFSMRKANEREKNRARTLKSDLDRVDSHRVRQDEYEELPELSEDMMARGSVKRAGRPVARDPRRQVTIRLPASVLAAWKATGPGWRTRMAG